MALPANALCTLAELKAYLSIPTVDTDNSARLESVIISVTDAFEEYTGRDTFISSLVVETTEGCDDDTLWVRNPPISETTSSVVICIDSERLYPAGDNLTRTDFAVYERTGKIVLIDDYFPSNPLCVRLTYYGGYSTLPGDVKRAALEACQFFWKREQDGRVGVSSVSHPQGGGVSYDESGLPKAVTDVLDRYRRWLP